MWILEAISDTPLKKYFLSVTISLGACFLLLANLFSQNALHHPLSYAVMAAAVWSCTDRAQPLAVALACAALSIASYLLLPSYQLLFAFVAAAVLGYSIFPATFQIWRTAVAGCLMFTSMLITQIWQRDDLLAQTLPLTARYGIEGMIFGFCVAFGAMILFLRKDRVREAIDSFKWNPDLESTEYVKQIGLLYSQFKSETGIQAKMRIDLAAATKKMITTCAMLQQIEMELANTDREDLRGEISWLQQKVDSVTDARARLQYEQALKNKVRRSDQLDEMLLQQERIRGRLLNYVSALENIRFARKHGMGTEEMHADVVDFFLDVAQAEAGV